jgi:D-methionine transport system permease protein
LLTPLTRFLVGSSIGTTAALVPLTLASALLVTRMVEGALSTVPQGLVETGLAMGASRWQIIQKILLPEALPLIVSGMTTVIINVIGFSAMAGAVGGGGLGDLAIRYGYQRYDFYLLLWIVGILIVLVQVIQLLGDSLSQALKRGG